MNTLKNFIWNEIESSPFFTASWEPRYLKKLIVIFGSGIIAFIAFSALFIFPTTTLPMYHDGNKYYIELIGFSTIAQPFMVVFTPRISKRLYVYDEGLFSYKVNGTSFMSSTLFKICHQSQNLRLEVTTNNTKYKALVKVQIPYVRYTSAFIKVITFLIISSCVFVSYKAPNIRPFFSQYLLIFLYSLFNLPFFNFDNLFRSFITMSFWFGFISVSFLQVRILSSNIPTIFSALFVIIAFASFATVLTNFNSNFLYVSFILLALLICASGYLFFIGTAILSRFLLAVHFGWMWTIGLSIYTANILRNMSISFQTSFFVDVMNNVIVAVFIVFQSIYLIGEPTKAKIPEAPLDQAAKINRIDHLLEKLADKEDNQSRKF